MCTKMYISSSMILLLLALFYVLPNSGPARVPLSPLKMTHSLKYHIIIAVEDGKGVFKNACNLFKQNPTHSSLLYWNMTTGHLRLLDGKRQGVSRDTMIHIVGHGGQPMTSKSTRLGGLTAKKLAHVVNLLPFKELKVGHISLVACRLHYHTDGHKGFLRSFLWRLISRYHIETTVSAWTMEVAVDPHGRLLSRMNSSSSWYMNYPGSLVVASIVDRKNRNVTRKFEAGYSPQKNEANTSKTKRVDLPCYWYKNCSCMRKKLSKKSKRTRYVKKERKRRKCTYLW